MNDGTVYIATHRVADSLREVRLVVEAERQVTVEICAEIPAMAHSITLARDEVGELVASLTQWLDATEGE